MQTLVTYRCTDGIATIAMDDGKRNVLGPPMLAALGEALDRAEADRAPIVLTGREGTFSGGFDLNVLRVGGDTTRALVRSGFELGARLLAFPTPVVVACTGHAIAMGVFLVLAGDHRLAAAGPWRIGATEVAIGLTMPFFGIEMCRQRLAPAWFQRAVLTAEVFGPDDAATAGFVDAVVPPTELARRAHEVVAALARLDPATYAATKRRLRAPTLEAVRASIASDATSFGA